MCFDISNSSKDKTYWGVILSGRNYLFAAASCVRLTCVKSVAVCCPGKEQIRVVSKSHSSSSRMEWGEKISKRLLDEKRLKVLGSYAARDVALTTTYDHTFHVQACSKVSAEVNDEQSQLVMYSSSWSLTPWVVNELRTILATKCFPRVWIVHIIYSTTNRSNHSLLLLLS